MELDEQNISRCEEDFFEFQTEVDPPSITTPCAKSATKVTYTLILLYTSWVFQNLQHQNL